MANDWCVYEHVFPNGKKYIGITSDPQQRWRNGKGYDSQGKIANAIRHYGWQNIKHNIIVDGLERKQATALERYLIAELNTIDNGYNTAVGGDSINATYLNDHVLYMIRESKRIDKRYGYEQKDDDIVSGAEKSKYNKEYADVFNRADELIETKYNEYKRYTGSSIITDFAAVRVDCYWWTVARIISNSMPEGDTPYWDFWRKETWQTNKKSI